jgi:PAS domain S-box-containing protein
MTGTARPAVDPESEIRDLRRRLEEAEETIAAIRAGAVDAFVVQESTGDRVYTLQSAERPYRVLVECMQQGALVLTRDGIVLFGNGRIAELLDMPHERLVGARLAQFVAPAERESLDRLLVAASAGNGRAEVSLRRADGSVLPVDLTVSPLPLGETAALCAVVTDLTEKRHREALELAEAALRDADRRKDEFIATLAHELRNPLAPTRSALEILRLKAGEDPEVRWAEDVIDRQVQQMTRLVDDLLDLSRITRDQIALRRERIDIAVAIGSAVETSQPLISEFEHKLSVLLPSEPLVVHADLNRLAQVFANLLNNAAKYTDRGGQISLTAWKEGGEAVISVKDNGVGIPTDLLPRVFEMFTQAPRSPDRTDVGLGIGLTLVKRLVEMHGGRVVARSAGPQLGSEFEVRLPGLAEKETAERADVVRESTTLASVYRVLIVDDNRDSADSLSVMLRMRGSEVRAAYGGAAALSVAESFRPDVVLLDLSMPRVNGYDTCRAIRRQQWAKEVVIVAVTGWGQLDDRRRALESGFDYHLVKPVDADSLTRIFAELAARRGHTGARSFNAQRASDLTELRP